MDEQTRREVQQRALASALLSMAAGSKNLSMLRTVAEEFRDEPDLKAIYAGVRATSPIHLPELETLLDPDFSPDRPSS